MKKIILLILLLPFSACSIQSVGSLEEMQKDIQILKRENEKNQENIKKILELVQPSENQQNVNMVAQQIAEAVKKGSGMLQYKNISLSSEIFSNFGEDKKYKDSAASFINSSTDKKPFLHSVHFTDQEYLKTFNEVCKKESTCTGFQPLSTNNFQARKEYLQNNTPVGRFEISKIGDKTFLADRYENKEYGLIKEYVTFFNDVQVVLYVSLDTTSTDAQADAVIAEITWK